MSEVASGVRRPLTVTVVAVLAILTAVTAILTGVLLFGSLSMPRVAVRTERNPSALLYVLFVAGWCILGAVVQITGAVFLLRGARWARILLSVLFVSQIGFTAMNSAVAHDGPSSTVFVTVAAALALVALWSRAPSVWLARSGRDSVSAS